MGQSLAFGSVLCVTTFCSIAHNTAKCPRECLRHLLNCFPPTEFLIKAKPWCDAHPPVAGRPGRASRLPWAVPWGLCSSQRPAPRDPGAVSSPVGQSPPPFSAPVLTRLLPQHQLPTRCAPPTLCFHRHRLSLWLEDTRLRVGLLLLLGDVPQGLWMRLAHSGDTEHVCSMNLEFSQELASGRWDEVWVVGSER